MECGYKAAVEITFSVAAITVDCSSLPVEFSSNSLWHVDKSVIQEHLQNFEGLLYTITTKITK